MRLTYDLHIHSCLSPCGDSDMTPNNIVNMALLAVSISLPSPTTTAAATAPLCCRWPKEPA